MREIRKSGSAGTPSGLPLGVTRPGDVDGEFGLTRAVLIVSTARFPIAGREQADGLELQVGAKQVSRSVRTSLELQRFCRAGLKFSRYMSRSPGDADWAQATRHSGCLLSGQSRGCDWELSQRG